jgi:hypothetical protein
MLPRERLTAGRILIRVVKEQSQAADGQRHCRGMGFVQKIVWERSLIAITD